MQRIGAKSTLFLKNGTVAATRLAQSLAVNLLNNLCSFYGLS